MRAIPLKRLLLILSFCLVLSGFSQEIRGVYKGGNNLYSFSKHHHKTIEFDNFFNPDTIREQPFVYEGRYILRKNTLQLISRSRICDFQHGLSIVNFTDSGFYILSNDFGDQLFVRKLKMEQKEFDSIYKIHKQMYDPCRGSFKTIRISNETSSAKKIVLQNSSNHKTKIISQKIDLSFTRIYVDSLFGKTDTILQQIEGHIDSMDDSLIYIQASSFRINNHYNLIAEYEWYNWEKPEIDFTLNYFFEDTLIIISKNQLYNITQTSGRPVPGYMMITFSTLNILATPFYSLDYKTYQMNKSLFKNSIFISLAVLTAGILEIIIFPGEKDYRLKNS